MNEVNYGIVSGPMHIWNKPHENCQRCGVPLNVGMVLLNSKEPIIFPYMKMGEGMHIECYINHVMDIYWEKKT